MAGFDIPYAAGVTGLENVDNTSDLDKPISTATQVALDEMERLLHLTFTSEAVVIEAEAGDFAAHEILGWVKNQAEIVLAEYKDVPVFIVPDVDAKIYNIEKSLTFQDIQNLHLYGGVFGGRIALDIDDGSNGCFTSMDTTEATSILNSDGITFPFLTGINRRVNAAFKHNGTNVRVVAVEGTSGLICNGVDTVNVVDWNGVPQTNTVPEILAGDFFDYEVHVQNGLDQRMYLYINGILVDNPVFAENTGGTSGNRLSYVSGSSTGVDRITYIRTFGATINTSESELLVTKEELESHDSVKLIIPNGTRNYSLVIEKDLHLDIGFTYEFLSQTTGMISWAPAVGTGIAGTIDGLSTGDIEVSGITEIKRINVLQDGAQFTLGDDDALAKIVFKNSLSAINSGLVQYNGLSLPIVDEASALIGAGSGKIIDITNSVIHNVSWVEQTVIWPIGEQGAATTIDDSNTVHFFIHKNGVISRDRHHWPWYTEISEKIYLGNCDINISLDGFTAANNPVWRSTGMAGTLANLMQSLGGVKWYGGDISAGATPLGIDISSVITATRLGGNFADKDNPNTLNMPAIQSPSFSRGYNISGRVTYGQIFDTLDPNNYQLLEQDNTLTAVPTGKFTIQKVFGFAKSESWFLLIHYGSVFYETIEQARLNLESEPFNEDYSLRPAMFLGWIIIKEGTTNLASAISSDDARIINNSSPIRPPFTSGVETIQTNLKGADAFGDFSRSTDQTFVVDTATSIVFDKTNQFREVALGGTNLDEVIIQQPGLYDILLRIQPVRDGGNTGLPQEMYIWVELSTDDGLTWISVPDSALKLGFTSGGSSSSITHTTAAQLSAGNRVRFMVIVDNIQMFLHGEIADLVKPAVPSCRVIVEKASV